MKSILSIGGGGEGSKAFAAIARAEERRFVFAKTARGLVVRYGLDGIDSKFDY